MPRKTNNKLFSTISKLKRPSLISVFLVLRPTLTVSIPRPKTALSPRVAVVVETFLIPMAVAMLLARLFSTLPIR